MIPFSQLARKLVSAELQQITYREYLPNVLGSKALGDLTETETRYNPDMDPSILNEFATVAFRWSLLLAYSSFDFLVRYGHSTVADVFDGNSKWPLEKHFFE